MPMVVENESTNGYLCIHPALWGNLETTGMSNFWEFSHEFAAFWLAFNRGEFDNDNPSHRRCYRICMRRGCYGEKLIHGLGYPTETGKAMASDFTIALARMSRWYQQNNQIQPRWQDAQEMHEIVPMGRFSPEAIKIIQRLYEAVPPENRKHPNIHTYPYFIKMDWHVAKNGVTYLLTRCVNSNQQSRNGFETLIKLGLVDLVDLPRWDHQNGKGRRPVGAALSNAGIRFYDAFADLSDPIVIKERQWQRDYDLSRNDHEIEDHQNGQIPPQRDDPPQSSFLITDPTNQWFGYYEDQL